MNIIEDFEDKLDNPIEIISTSLSYVLVGAIITYIPIILPMLFDVDISNFTPGVFIFGWITKVGNFLVCFAAMRFFISTLFELFPNLPRWIIWVGAITEFVVDFILERLSHQYAKPLLYKIKEINHNKDCLWTVSWWRSDGEVHFHVESLDSFIKNSTARLTGGLSGEYELLHIAGTHEDAHAAVRELQKTMERNYGL